MTLITTPINAAPVTAGGDSGAVKDIKAVAIHDAYFGAGARTGETNFSGVVSRLNTLLAQTTTPLIGCFEPWGLSGVGYNLLNSPSALAQAMLDTIPNSQYFPVTPSTVFSDDAGTTPAVIGGPVGALRDAGGTLRATATGTGRPTFGRHPARGIVNLLRQTNALATQTRTVTNAQHTLSFRGTGTVTLSGASTAGPLVGTGAGDIVSLTFTPSAGSLTLTVTGTVEIAQLELGAARTGYQTVADAGGFDITETGQRNVFYIAPDGVDDVMTLSAAFAPAGAYTLAAAVNVSGGTTVPVFGRAAGNGQLGIAPSNRFDVVFGAPNRRVWNPGLIGRQIGTFRGRAAADYDFRRNGVDLAEAVGEAAGNIVPAVNPFDTIGRNGASYANMRFYGGALTPASLTDAQRNLLERALAYAAGVTLP
jgi:hypothetical protein